MSYELKSNPSSQNYSFSQCRKPISNNPLDYNSQFSYQSSESFRGEYD